MHITSKPLIVKQQAMPYISPIGVDKSLQKSGGDHFSDKQVWLSQAQNL